MILLAIPVESSAVQRPHWGRVFYAYAGNFEMGECVFNEDMEYAIDFYGNVSHKITIIFHNETNFAKYIFDVDSDTPYRFLLGKAPYNYAEVYLNTTIDTEGEVSIFEYEYNIVPEIFEDDAEPIEPIIITETVTDITPYFIGTGVSVICIFLTINAIMIQRRNED